MTYLFAALAFIVVVTGLLAISPTLRVARSLPCTGRVVEVSHLQYETQNQEGQTHTAVNSTYFVQYLDPVAGTPANGILKNIYAHKGQTVALLYNLQERTISVNSIFRIYTNALGFFAGTMLFWIIAFGCVLFR